MNCDEPEFWETRYRSRRTPWDLKGVPNSLQEYLRRRGKPGSALIPGCGSAYEVKAFIEAGWKVDAIDFSPAAVERAREILGSLARHVRLADFFADDFEGPFDLIYERTFLCSLPTLRWPEYVERVSDLLGREGVLAGIFFYGHDPDPPPYGLAGPNAQELFGADLQMMEDSAIPSKESLPIYCGCERWQVWRRRLETHEKPTP